MYFKKTNSIFYTLISSIFFLTTFGQRHEEINARFAHPTLSSWIDTCQRAPSPSAPSSAISPIVSKENFQLAQRQLSTLFDEKVFSQREKWTDKSPSTPKYNEFYLQKLILSTKTQVCLMGDIHGSLQALNDNLKELKCLGLLDENFLLSENVYLIILGDFIGRGPCSLEVLYILMRLILINPERVIIIRGNHEASTSLWGMDGFSEEVTTKYPEAHELLETCIPSIITIFPVALFVTYAGINEYALLTHGFIPLNIRYLNKFTSQPSACYQNLGLTSENPEINDFMWTDIFHGYIDSGRLKIISPEYPIMSTRGPTIKTISKEVIYGFLNADNPIKVVFRGHQHDFYGLQMLLDRDKDTLELDDERLSTLCHGHPLRDHIAFKRLAELPTDTTYFFCAHKVIAQAPLERTMYGTEPNFPDDVKLVTGIGPFNWQAIVNPEEITHPEGFLVTRHTPVYTFSTSSQATRCPFNCFGILTIEGPSCNWRLKVFERPAPEFKHLAS